VGHVWDRVPARPREHQPFTLYLTTHRVETGTPDFGGRADAFSWEQVREMDARCLMTLGSHSHNHLGLHVLCAESIAEKLALSNQLIRERTGVAVKHFSYPQANGQRLPNR
jgi:hypothetical protein